MKVPVVYCTVVEPLLLLLLLLRCRGGRPCHCHFIHFWRRTSRHGDHIISLPAFHKMAVVVVVVVNCFCFCSCSCSPPFVLPFLMLRCVACFLYCVALYIILYYITLSCYLDGAAHRRAIARTNGIRVELIIE